MLTGLIRCPQCGRGYVGTAAHGRTSSYRYYTCWSRVRYGTKAGCDTHRFNADAVETAIATALLDFYTRRGDLIKQAVADFRAQHAADSSRLRDELAAVARELKDTSAAIDRYLIAFEKGTLDDEDTTSATGSPSSRHSPSSCAAVRPSWSWNSTNRHRHSPWPTRPRSATGSGRSSPTASPNARKAMCEALIKEIVVIADDAVRPIFKLPLADNDEGLALDGPALSGSERAVRALPTMVDHTWQNPNRISAAHGPIVTVAAVRSRRTNA